LADVEAVDGARSMVVWCPLSSVTGTVTNGVTHAVTGSRASHTPLRNGVTHAVSNGSGNAGEGA
jgi:hypothetical protein